MKLEAIRDFPVSLNIIQGDHVFCQWHDTGVEDFRRKEHELRTQGFRKVNQDFDYMNLYVTYKRKKKRITVTLALC